jgi:uncharacterized membrane protein (TIGR02234 family)
VTSVPQQPHPGPATAPEQDAPAPGTPEAASAAVPVVAGPDAAAAARRRAGLRTLAVALPAGAVGAGLVLVAAGKTWSRGYAAFGQTSLPVHATGSDTTALPGALALVGLASLVAVFAVRRAGRYVVAALLALSGLGVTGTALTRRGDRAALNEAASSAAGLAHATAQHAATTGWPLVCAAGGVLLLAAGLLALRHGPAWPVMSGRYDRPGAAVPVRDRARASAAASRRPAAVDPDRAEDLWKALDRGEDPTEAAG